MPTIVCEACGASNPADASFCRVCHAFVGWDRTSIVPVITDRDAVKATRPVVEQSAETRMIPKIADVPPLHSGPAFSVRLEQEKVTLPVSGEPVEITVMITNQCGIVDGYEVDVGGAPSWLRVESSPLRLLPGSEEGLALRLHIESASLVPAGQNDVRLRIRSLNAAPAHEIVSITVVVPVVDAPVSLRAAPSVVRLQDVEVGRFVVTVDNASANRPAEIHLSGTDPELAVNFHFDPASLTVGPGESARVRAVTTSARPRPGTEFTRSLTVSATEGTRRVDTTVTLVQATSAVVEDPMVELTASPSLLRLRDGGNAAARVSIDNRGGRQWATVRLSASDPEQLVTAHWSNADVRVPPGGSTDVDLWLASPMPEAGTEVSHTVTLSASDGRRVARTQLTLVHVASPSPMTTLGVQLDPSVLRLGAGRRGTSTVVVDNRSGRLPAQVWLHGDDPENVVGFTFHPSQLTVGAGQVVTSRVAVTAPRAAGGLERTRTFTVAATDGRTAVTSTGTLSQQAADRRPWARVLLTLGGALAMIVGAMLPMLAVSPATAFDVTAEAIAGLFGATLDLGVFAGMATFGVVILVLAGLTVFGLTGRSGRLTRIIAVLTVLLTVGLLITVAFAGLSAAPAEGTVVIIIGAVLGYVGGLLARR